VISLVGLQGAGEGLPLTKIQAPNCLSHHPKSPLTTEEVIERARGGRTLPPPGPMSQQPEPADNGGRRTAAVIRTPLPG